MTINLDACFSAFPKISSPKGYDQQWKSTLEKLKKKKTNWKTKVDITHSIGKSTSYEATMNLGDEESKLFAKLLLPGKLGKFPLIITIHDYMETESEIIPELTQNGFAQLSITLPGHSKEIFSAHQAEQKRRASARAAEAMHTLAQQPNSSGVPSGTPTIARSPMNQKSAMPDHDISSSESKQSSAKHEDELATFGYLKEKAENRDEYFLYRVYTSLLLAVHHAAKLPNINANKIGVYGKGVGAAAAIYCAWLNDSVGAIFLDRPFPCNLDVALNKGKGQFIQEMKKPLTGKGKTKVKATYQWLDSLQVAEKIKCPVGMGVGYLDKTALPEAIFGFFNHLQCPKDVLVFPTLGHDKTNAEINKSVTNFFMEYLQGIIPDNFS